MNEETTLQTEVPADQEVEVVTEPDATEATEASDGALIYEDFSGFEVEETIAGTVITLEDLQSISNYNAHVDLFGSFVVCGTLVGLALLRDRHGN